MIQIELVKYDPDNFDTYPSVCVDSSEVRSRFGFTAVSYTHLTLPTTPYV